MKKWWIYCSIFALLLVTACSNGAGSSRTDNVYKLGVVFPLSGNAAENGKDMLAGVQFAVDEVNAAGGIKGVPVKIVEEDGQGLPKESVNATQKLVTVDKVPVVFTGFSSPVLASAPLASQYKVLLVNAGAATPRLAHASDYLLNTLVLQNIELDYLTKYVSQEFGVKRMALIYQNNDLGLGIKDALQEYMTKLGGQLVAAESYEVGAIDFRSQLTKIGDVKPDALYVASAGKDTPLIIKQAREMGINCLLLSYHAFEMPKEYMAIAGKYAEGALYTSSFVTVNDEFSKKWAKKYGAGNVPEISAMYYDASRMVFEGIGRAVEKGYGVTGEGIRRAIFEIKDFNGVTGHMVMPETGNALRAVAIKKIENGEFKVIKTIEP